jgi:hypothetical protein
MTNEIRIGRLAGALYLIVVLAGMFSLMYVPSRITVSGDAHATMGNLVAHGSLFRAGIAAFLLKQVAFLLLPLVLFKLLRQVNHDIAVLMVVLAVVSVPIALVSLVNKLDALDVLVGYFGQTLAPAQIQSQAMLSLDAYDNGILVTTLFWGLWLLPFGYLVMRSGFLPRVLGLFLVLGGLGYVAQVFWQILVPDMEFPDAVLFTAAVGEIGICLWLLLIGVRRRRPGAA